MSLPDLSGLSISQNLFEHLVKECVAKSEDCEDADVCDEDGFLMFKTIDTPRYSDIHVGKDVTLTKSGLTFTALPVSLRTTEEKLDYFRKKHSEWVQQVFYRLCNRGKDLGSITWTKYGKELMSITDWYFLDFQKRGQMFVSLVDDEASLENLHLEKVGVFSKRFLYIALVCAKPGFGFGKIMLNAAEELARELGCAGIVLASLINSAGVYFSQGYRFTSRINGKPIDVEAWVENELQKDGSVKRRLNPDKPKILSPPNEPRGSKRRHESDEYVTEDDADDDADGNESEPDVDYLKDKRSKSRKLFDWLVDGARIVWYGASLAAGVSHSSYEVDKLTF